MTPFPNPMELQAAAIRVAGEALAAQMELAQSMTEATLQMQKAALAIWSAARPVPPAPTNAKPRARKRKSVPKVPADQPAAKKAVPASAARKAAATPTTADPKPAPKPRQAAAKSATNTASAAEKSAPKSAAKPDPKPATQAAKPNARPKAEPEPKTASDPSPRRKRAPSPPPSMPAPDKGSRG